MKHHLALAVFLGVFSAWSVADAPTYSMTAHIISSGASTHASSTCYALDAVIAEPVAGFSAGGTYTLSAGFLAASPIANDTLFGNGFEDCSP